MPMYARRFSGIANRRRYGRAAGYAGAMTRSAPGFNTMNPLLDPGAQDRAIRQTDANTWQHYQAKIQEQQEADRHLASVLGLQTQQLHNQIALGQHQLGLAREGYGADPAQTAGAGLPARGQPTLMMGGAQSALGLGRIAAGSVLPAQGGQAGLVRPGSLEAFQQQQRGFQAARENRPYRVTDATLAQAAGMLPSENYGPEPMGPGVPFTMTPSRAVRLGRAGLPARTGYGPEPAPMGLQRSQAVAQPVGPQNQRFPGTPAQEMTRADAERKYEAAQEESRRRYQMDQERLELARQQHAENVRSNQEAERGRAYDRTGRVIGGVVGALGGVAQAGVKGFFDLAQERYKGAQQAQEQQQKTLESRREGYLKMAPEEAASLVDSVMPNLHYAVRPVGDASFTKKVSASGYETGETALTQGGRRAAAMFKRVMADEPNLTPEQAASRVAAKLGYLNFADKDFDKKLAAKIGKKPNKDQLQWAEDMRQRRADFLGQVKQATAPYQVKAGIKATAEQMVLDAMNQGYTPQEAMEALVSKGYITR